MQSHMMKAIRSAVLNLARDLLVDQKAIVVSALEDRNRIRKRYVTDFPNSDVASQEPNEPS